MSYSSPNAPEVRDVLGTWLLSILDGQKRYAHVACLRGDTVAPEILNMNKIISDESLRRALAHLAPSAGKRCTEEEQARRCAQLAWSAAWMDEALEESVSEALNTPWILDCDTTIKPLYGHQAEAEVSYSPRKPGQPSHAIHTYWIGNVRMVLDAEVQSGKAHAAKRSLTHHSGQPRLLVTINHVAGEQIKSMIANVRKGLDHILHTAPQLPKLERWKSLVRYIVAKIIAAKSKDQPPLRQLPLGMAQFATG